MSSYKRNDLQFNSSKCDVYSGYSSSELTENLKERLKRVVQARAMKSRTTKTPKSAVIESIYPESDDDWMPANKGTTELTNKDSQAYGTFEPDCVDRAVSEELLLLLHGALLKAQEGDLKRRVMLPADMLQKLALEVVRMARSEPYGLRGAVLYLNLEQEGGSVSLGRIECNSHVAATFEVNITLTEDIKRWCTLKDLVVRGLFGCKDTELYLAPGYKLVKHKLYRSNSAASC